MSIDQLHGGAGMNSPTSRGIETIVSFLEVLFGNIEDGIEICKPQYLAYSLGRVHQPHTTNRSKRH
jgi:hypothetical protein